jgi:hypothetical protein
MRAPLKRTSLLTTRQVSENLERRGTPRSVATLEKLRCRGGGPPFQHFGRDVRYPADGLESWFEATLSAPVWSTAELRKAGRRRGK